MREEGEIKGMMLLGEGNSKINLHLRQTSIILTSHLRVVNKNLVNMEFDETYFGQTRFMCSLYVEEECSV